MNVSATVADSLADRISRYRNTAEHNDGLHAEFTRLTDSVPLLKRHRDWVEANKWGYGDRAFHYLWWLVLPFLAERFGPLRALEIGVFKGQTISLWGLIARERGIDLAGTVGLYLERFVSRADSTT